MSVLFLKSVFNISNLPTDNLPEILLVGRSNVGKSTFINTLFNRKSLARVSKTPGKTIALNYYLVDDLYYLVDSPGYGFAKRSYQEQESFKKLMDSYLSKRQNLVLVLVLVDNLVGPTKDDLKMIDYLKETKIPFEVLLTKADKVKPSQKAKRKKEIMLLLPHLQLTEISSKLKTSYEQVSKTINYYITKGKENE